MSEPKEVVIWDEGRRMLLEDPAFGPLVDRTGPVRAPDLTGEDPFHYLARAIVYQQLAGAAARTIHGRFVEALGGTVTQDAVLAAPEDELRGAGLSASKLKAIRDLAERLRAGDVALDALGALDDEAVVRELTKVWGIGEWTAHMYLMFGLHRPDVWPVGDLGVRQGYATVQGLAEAPAQKEMTELGEPYRPWRSAAAWYCWRALEVETP